MQNYSMTRQIVIAGAKEDDYVVNSQLNQVTIKPSTSDLLWLSP